MFEWLKKLFKRKSEDDIQWDYGDDSSTQVLDRSKMDLSNSLQMDKYVRGCCEQIREATEEIDKSTMEYRLVTEYLTDIEEIEQMPPEDRARIDAVARKIAEAGADIKLFKSRTGSMGEDKYRQMERLEDDMPDALTELVKNEEYKALVKQDMQSLEGEKFSYKYRQMELVSGMKLCRELVVIVLFATVCTVLLLSFFKLAMGFEVELGYLLAAAAGAIALTGIFIKYGDSKRELSTVEKKLNQAIMVQNTVKIRYVNITNVIEYAYAKFGVNSSNELDYLWGKYVVEKQERENLRVADARLSREQNELVGLLREHRLVSPEIWIRQAEALIDPKEMVEIRHGLIVRRQSLRKRIDYNQSNRQAAKDEVTELVRLYPDQARLILGIVDEYD